MIDLRDRQIGLGTFPFSNVFSPVSQEEAEVIVKTFVNMGGHYIETAPTYPINKVDLAKIIGGFRREELYIGTKCVLYVNQFGQKLNSGKKHDIRQQCLNELQRLKIDYIDLLEAHLSPTNTSPSEVAEALHQLKKEGLVRYIGAANVSISDLLSYNEGGDIDFVQNRYSIIHRQEITNILNEAINRDIRFNPYQLIERGQLISTSKNAGYWEKDDLRGNKNEYTGEAYRRIRKWVLNRLVNIAQQGGMSLEELAIRWTFSNPQVTLPVIGATKKQQVEKNMKAEPKPLPSDIMQAIEQEYKILEDEIYIEKGMSIEEYRGLKSFV